MPTKTDARKTRATQLDGEITQIDATTYRVPSASKDGQAYVVDVDAPACTCPDHVYRGTTCKHMYRAADAAGVLTLNGADR